MSNIHDIFKDECVSGVIVGGGFICAKLYYEGRQQGRKIYAESRERVKEIALFMKKELIADLGDALAKEIYPNNSAWRVVIFN